MVQQNYSQRLPPTHTHTFLLLDNISIQVQVSVKNKLVYKMKCDQLQHGLTMHEELDETMRTVAP